MMKVDKLKILSIIIFLIIARTGNEHVVLPMFLIIFSVIYIFTDFNAVLLPFLAFIGIVLILVSLVKKNNYILTLGYFLTYLILFQSFIDKSLYENPQREIYFLITATAYFVLSLYILLKSWRVKVTV